MHSQQRLVSMQNTIEIGPDSSERGLAPTKFVTVKFPESRPPEEKEGDDVESGLTIIANTTDDYPDGGLAAWSVVLGVGEYQFPCFRNSLTCLVRILRLPAPFLRRRLHSPSRTLNH